MEALFLLITIISFFVQSATVVGVQVSISKGWEKKREIY